MNPRMSAGGRGLRTPISLTRRMRGPECRGICAEMLSPHRAGLATPVIDDEAPDHLVMDPVDRRLVRMSAELADRDVETRIDRGAALPVTLIGQRDDRGGELLDP